jgi:hypothetical protein
MLKLAAARDGGGLAMLELANLNVELTQLGCRINALLHSGAERGISSFKLSSLSF